MNGNELVCVFIYEKGPKLIMNGNEILSACGRWEVFDMPITTLYHRIYMNLNLEIYIVKLCIYINKWT